jgi:predicted ATPase
LLLQLAVGPALIAVKGYAVPEVERAYIRMRELCEQLGDPAELSPTLFGLWLLYLVRGELRKAYELAEELLHRAESTHDLGLLIYAHFALGVTSFWRGELPLAREHLEMAISLYDPERHRSLIFRYGGANAGVICLSYAAWTLWQLGYPDEALKRGNEALALAQGLSHPFSLAWADFSAGLLGHYRREARAAQEDAKRLIVLSGEHGFTHWWASASGVLGWAMAEQGRHEEGIAQIQQCLATSRAIGEKVFLPQYLCWLARAYIETGRFEGARGALTEALAAADQHENRFHEKAETYRLKGELFLRQDDPNIAEAQRCFERAIEIARKQNAKSWELRATMSLVRLLAKQGRRDEARMMLADIYNWFTEGFDTADLKDAKALLDQLSE